MKEYECVEVNHHEKVTMVIQKYTRNGWRLHTYQATGLGILPIVAHYLLFEKG